MKDAAHFSLRSLQLHLQTSPVIRSLAVFRSEVRYRIARLRGFPGRGESVGDLGTQERKLLRDILRRCPYWIRGHVLLGESELRAMTRGEERPTPRGIATVRVSANAALTLDAYAARSRRELVATEVHAKYLLAMVSYFLGDHRDALARLTTVLAFNNAQRLPEKIYFEALENAAASALAVGEQKTALEFFGRIPHGKLSQEGRSALEVLTKKVP